MTDQAIQDNKRMETNREKTENLLLGAFLYGLIGGILGATFCFSVCGIATGIVVGALFGGWKVYRIEQRQKAD